MGSWWGTFCTAAPLGCLLSAVSGEIVRQDREPGTLSRSWRFGSVRLRWGSNPDLAPCCGGIYSPFHTLSLYVLGNGHKGTIQTGLFC